MNLLSIDHKKTIKLTITVMRRVCYFPFKFFAFVNFSIRKTLFGSGNALNYLTQIDAEGVIFILCAYGAKIGKNCDIQPGITFHNCKNFKNLLIGNNCHIGKGCFFDLRDSVTVEDNVVISMYSKFVTHIDMTKSVLSDEFPAASAGIRIGSDSYLGIGSTVLMGVELGSKVLVGANSLVNVSVPSNSRVAGTPCKAILSKNTNESL
ncbi:DapH/DapD/GlmU-related protein [Oleiphilus sp. HI0086]|uniref:acyltransferase n=1 Tax=Oleiphilus sp. HI0086 TaxID=1822260 RepID=UPI0007C3034C|nr:acyltransferase [Oleiphilus sp. HI0086]KZZ34850.1 hypothetical protein A3756_17065 [Oleiphilus sp. HI0086]KZZ37502.1 hypothetical protein A3756_25470 [Oleiphilus sp. HI0086]